jgi:hypothetical protein
VDPSSPTSDNGAPVGPDRQPGEPPADRGGQGDTGRSSLIYCGLCGALNPATNHFCAACGTTLVDAFHATEGLRVFERPDPAARLIEIVPSGQELDVVEDPEAPGDYVRVRLRAGRLGYVRLADVAALEVGDATVMPGQIARAPDINTNARGCVGSSAALGAVALLLATTTLLLILLALSDDADTSLMSAIFCVAVLPFLLLTIGFYLYSRSREERLAEEEGAQR